MGRLARGELLAGRVEGRPTPSRPGVDPEAGGADAGRLTGADGTLTSDAADVGWRSAWAGEPGGVVLPARTAAFLGSSSLGGV